MKRLLPEVVVNAFRRTGKIPVRLAWTTKDARGCCAIDAVATALGVGTDAFRRTLDNSYETGFLAAWDADDPHAPDMVEAVKKQPEVVKDGYCDGILCRRAVEGAFSSALFVPTDTGPDQAV